MPTQGMVFPGVQKTTWTLRQGSRRLLLPPLLRVSSPTSTPRTREVQAEILKIMGFWIQLGVSGFRMDAVPFVIATKGAKVRKPVEQYDMLRTFREFLQWRQGDCDHPRRSQRAARRPTWSISATTATACT